MICMCSICSVTLENPNTERTGIRYIQCGGVPRTHTGGFVRRRETTVHMSLGMLSFTGPFSFSDVIHHDVIQLWEPGTDLEGAIWTFCHCELNKPLSVIRDQPQVFCRVTENELEQMARTRYGGKACIGSVHLPLTGTYWEAVWDLSCWVLMGASLHRYGWLYHWPLVTNIILSSFFPLWRLGNRADNPQRL